MKITKLLLILFIGVYSTPIQSMDDSREDVSRESRDSGPFEDQLRKFRKITTGLLEEVEEEQSLVSFHPDTPAFDADADAPALPQLSEKREREAQPTDDLQRRVEEARLATILDCIFTADPHDKFLRENWQEMEKTWVKNGLFIPGDRSPHKNEQGEPIRGFFLNEILTLKATRYSLPPSTKKRRKKSEKNSPEEEFQSIIPIATPLELETSTPRPTRYPPESDTASTNIRCPRSALFTSDSATHSYCPYCGARKRKKLLEEHKNECSSNPRNKK